MNDLRLIVALGNPGAKYLRTRHNAGFWFADSLAADAAATFRNNAKLHGMACQVDVAGRRVCVLKPSTFMNASGQAVAAALAYFKLAPEQCLVVHDDLDLPPGTVRLKFDGGHGGQNGVRDIIKHVGHGRFLRLRIGTGHPATHGQREAVLSWVLGQPSAADEDAIIDAINRGLTVLPLVVGGDVNEAMKRLHTTA